MDRNELFFHSFRDLRIAPEEGYITDHSLTCHEGVWHLFATTGRLGTDQRYPGSEEQFCHGVSEDLVTWRFVEPVLECGVRGDFDATKIRSPHVVLCQGKFWLFYTGIRTAKNLGTARVGLALSPSQDRWRKLSSKPILSPTQSENMWDPYVLWDSSRKGWVMYYTSRSNTHDQVGVATSQNLGRWNDHGIVLEMPRKELSRFCATESPCVVHDSRRDSYVMFLNHGTVESRNAVRGWGDLTRYHSHEDRISPQGRSRESFYPHEMPPPALRPRDIGYAGKVIRVGERWFRTGIFSSGGYSHLRFFEFEWRDDAPPRFFV